MITLDKYDQRNYEALEAAVRRMPVGQVAHFAGVGCYVRIYKLSETHWVWERIGKDKTDHWQTSGERNKNGTNKWGVFEPHPMTLMIMERMRRSRKKVRHEQGKQELHHPQDGGGAGKELS